MPEASMLQRYAPSLKREWQPVPVVCPSIRDEILARVVEARFFLRGCQREEARTSHQTDFVTNTASLCYID